MGNVMRLKQSKGMAIETVAYVVLAVIALIIFWIFLTDATPAVISLVDAMVTSIKCAVCEMFGSSAQLLLARSICKGC